MVIATFRQLREALDDPRLMGVAGRFSLWFSAAVLALSRYYRNWGLAAVALGIGIVGALCYRERRRQGLQ